MKLGLAGLGLVCLLSMGARAQTGTSFRIMQVIESNHLVIVKMSGAPLEFKPGRVFLVTLQDGKQCSLSFLESVGDLIKLDSTPCQRAGEIPVTAMVEPSLMEATIPTSPAVAPDTVVKSAEASMPKAESLDPASPVSAGDKIEGFFVSVQYSNADQVYFKDAYVTTTSGGGPLEITIESEPAFGMGAGYTRMAPRSWGFSILGMFEFNRAVKSLHLKGAGGSANLSANERSKFSIFLLESNAIYRWNQFYLPFGFHFAKVTLSGEGTDTINVDNGAGVHLGAGFFVGSRTSLEFFVRSTAFRMRESDSTGTLDYGTGTLVGVGLAGKFFF